MKRMVLVGILACAGIDGAAQDESSWRATHARFAVVPDRPIGRPPTDWLVDASPYRAGIWRTAAAVPELVLDNGLIRRTIRLAPNAATIGLRDLRTGAELLRAVRPEAELVLDGTRVAVGGLVGQPNHAYLTDAWLDGMRADPDAFRFVGFAVGTPGDRGIAWKRVRHAAPDVEWPPRGVVLRLDFRAPEPRRRDVAARADSAVGRELLWSEAFESALGDAWRVHRTAAIERASFANEGKTGELWAPANACVFAERDLAAGTRLVEAEVAPGTDGAKSWGNGLALVWDDRIVKINLRAADGADDACEIGVWDGASERLGPRVPAGARRLRLRLDDRAIHCEFFVAGDDGGSGAWAAAAVVERDAACSGDPRSVRVGKTSKSGGRDDFGEPGPVGRARVERVATYGAFDASPDAPTSTPTPFAGVTVSVHYELYDGLPVVAKWLSITNGSDRPLEVDRFTSELLAVVEHANWVEHRAGVAIPRPRSLHVETDYAFGGFTPENAMRHTVHWQTDPEFTSQVNWARKTPCLLRVEPAFGPDRVVEPGARFETFRAFELVQDSTERERRGLSQRRTYRTLAPWVTENPLILHVVSTDPDVVRRAIDQAAECGFEMLSLSFGSGLNMEDDSAANHAKFAALAAYGRERGIQLGGYSLLSSRRVKPESDNCVNPATGEPGGQTHGFCPALASAWGQDYFAKLYAFFEATGFLQFTHDGSYPGDLDASTRPPLQRGVDDSQWVQWEIITRYYRWLRARGAYLRVPDYYYWNGANECGMGYREVNWSLPRAEQVVHTRQNIFDGTWTKTPSMGWMFVPLTQYHGGGAAATIEPLDDHVAHYERMLLSNLGLGVQAVYRGHRLYDTPRVRDMVKRCVDWYQRYRDILESDVVHGRRADGRDVDWLLHVNPKLEQKGMLVVYNPLDEAASRTLRVDLHYTGIVDRATLRRQGGDAEVVDVRRDGTVDVVVDVPAQGMTWVVIE